MKLRKIVIISCVVIILISGYYSYWYSQKRLFSLKNYLENEEECHGREIALTYRKVTEVGPGYLKIHELNRDIRVIGEIKEISPGEVISLKGIFQKGAAIELTDYYISKDRWLKYTVSILATFLVFLWIGGNFKINWRDFSLVERKTCRTS